MKIGNSFLFDAEKQLFIDILFEFKRAVMFNNYKMNLLDLSIELSIFIPTVLYELW